MQEWLCTEKFLQTAGATGMHMRVWCALLMFGEEAYTLQGETVNVMSAEKWLLRGAFTALLMQCEVEWAFLFWAPLMSPGGVGLLCLASLGVPCVALGACFWGAFWALDYP